METLKPPQPPCERFNKKKAITCYLLNRSSLDLGILEHYEYCRVTNPTPGEYYVIPIATLQKKVTSHLSYHKSGVFHWKEEDNPNVRP